MQSTSVNGRLGGTGPGEGHNPVDCTVNGPCHSPLWSFIVSWIHSQTIAAKALLFKLRVVDASITTHDWNLQLAAYCPTETETDGKFSFL